MAIELKPGLVIRYDFLWKDEDRAGREHGLKDRPCAIVSTSKTRQDGGKDVIVCPITHSPPDDKASAIEIPLKVARFLNLDEGRSWIRTHEVNTFEWSEGHIPFGMTPAHEGEWAFGQLPYELGKKMFDQVLERSRDKSLEMVKRVAHDKPS